VLRLVFALLVVLMHTSLLSGHYMDLSILRMGQPAVYGFFIITGYVIAGSAGRSATVSSYLMRRFWRIYPAYFVLIIVQAGCLLALADNGARWNEVEQYLAYNLLFLNWLQPTIGNALSSLDMQIINGSLWTLKIEVVFYLLAPLLVWLMRARGALWLIGLLVASMGFHVAMVLLGHDTLAKQAPGLLFLFIIGMLIHRYRSRLPKIPARWALPVAGLLFIALSYVELLEPAVGVKELCLQVVKTVLLTGFVTLTAFLLRPIKVKLDVSYGVYLWHYPIIQMLLLAGAGYLTFWLLLVIVCVLALLAGGASAILVERRCNRLGSYLSDLIIARHPLQNRGVT
jgi:peptidoglycan/LPS O-acetylase OafA/YrhL